MTNIIPRNTTLATSQQMNGQVKRLMPIAKTSEHNFSKFVRDNKFLGSFCLVTKTGASTMPNYELHGDNFLKNLNNFLGQYGHGTSHLDTFKIWEAEAARQKLVGNGPRLLAS